MNSAWDRAFLLTEFSLNKIVVIEVLIGQIQPARMRLLRPTSLVI
jgi:hypothetical protein